MGLSFILKELVGATSLQAFAAGAALSATSLGTTFTILTTTDLIATRLGTVTTSAAMLDDVVGLVMVQIIANLGESGSSFNALTVIRPLFVSIGFTVGLFLLCGFFIKPIFKRVLFAAPKVPDFMGTMQFSFLYQTALLVGLVASATYAGTSSLFAAYLAGVIITWFDGMIAESKSPSGASISHSHSPSGQPHTDDTTDIGGLSRVSSAASPDTQCDETPTGEKVYEKYYKQPVGRILTPLFFVSVASHSRPAYSNLVIGINWVCNPDHGDVQRQRHLARSHLRNLNDVGKNDYRSLAGTFLDASSRRSREWFEKTILSPSSLLCAYKK